MMRNLILCTLMLLIAAAGPPPEGELMVPGGRSGFVTDGKGGCWLWVGGLGRGARDVTASWTGDCPEGPAEGNGRAVVRWREDGQDRAMIYEGGVRRGKNEGRGRIQHIDEGRVRAAAEGMFRNDHFVEGRFEFLLQGLVYEGGWSPAGPEGQGRASQGGRSFEGVWESGCLRTEQGWLSFTRPIEECEGVRT
jgi:hypothetical protein